MDEQSQLMHILKNVGLAVLWSFIGMALFGIAFFVIKEICPFSIRKEIEEHENTALAIVIGAVMIGIALIVAAAIH